MCLCWPEAWGNSAVNAGIGAPRASNLGPGRHPLLPDLPDLPNTFLEHQKFHSLWLHLSKTPMALSSPASFPCLVVAFPSWCLWAALGLVALFALLGPPGHELLS